MRKVKIVTKVLFILIISIFLLIITTQTNFAAGGISGTVIGIGTQGEGINIDSGVYSVAGTIINWIWWISIILAIIAIMIIGIKYITGGVSEKTMSKKSLIILVVGVILVVFATSIVKGLFNAFS